MKAVDRLRAAQWAAREGRHAHALDEFIWFHHHALKEEPALSGVRRSYALSYWVELGKEYPEALRALEQLRDQYTTALLAESNERGAFIDVSAINEYLHVVGLTHQLFVQLAERKPALAKSCARVAMPAIVDAEDFALAARYLPEASAHIQALCRELNDDIRMIKHRAYTGSPLRWATILNCTKEIALFMAVKRGTGCAREADQLLNLSLASLQSPSVRRDFQATLSGRFNPPRPPRQSRCKTLTTTSTL